MWFLQRHNSTATSIIDIQPRSASRASRASSKLRSGLARVTKCLQYMRTGAKAAQSMDSVVPIKPRVSMAESHRNLAATPPPLAYLYVDKALPPLPTFVHDSGARPSIVASVVSKQDGTVHHSSPLRSQPEWVTSDARPKTPKNDGRISFLLLTPTPPKRSHSFGCSDCSPSKSFLSMTSTPPRGNSLRGSFRRSPPTIRVIPPSGALPSPPRHKSRLLSNDDFAKLAAMRIPHPYATAKARPYTPPRGPGGEFIRLED